MTERLRHQIIDAALREAGRCDIADGVRAHRDGFGYPCGRDFEDVPLIRKAFDLAASVVGPA